MSITNGSKPEKKSLEKGKALRVVLFLVYMLLLVWAIIFKLQFFMPYMPGRVLNLIPFMGSFDPGGLFYSGEIRANIIAFIPLGVYLCLLKSEWPFLKKVLVAVGVSFGLELMQFVFMIGRADITDLFSNGIGAAIGIGLYALLSKLLKDRVEGFVTITAAVITGLILLLVTVLMLSGRWIILI